MPKPEPVEQHEIDQLFRDISTLLERNFIARTPALALVLMRLAARILVNYHATDNEFAEHAASIWRRAVTKNGYPRLPIHRQKEHRAAMHALPPPESEKFPELSWSGVKDALRKLQ